MNAMKRIQEEATQQGGPNEGEALRFALLANEADFCCVARADSLGISWYRAHDRSCSLGEDGHRAWMLRGVARYDVLLDDENAADERDATPFRYDDFVRECIDEQE